MDLDLLEKSTRQRIGDRIRSARVQRNYSLNDLANRSGVSASTIHKIENYNMVPTVTTLLKIARGLRKDLHFFLDDTDSRKDYVVIRKNEGTITRMRSQRSLIRAISSKFDNTHLEVHHTTVEKGGMSAREDLIHNVEEVAICLKGRFEFVIGGERVTLEPLDSIHIRRGARHRWKNVWSDKAELLFIFTPPLFS